MGADIETIRKFNRTVTRRLGVLNERYLGRERPLAAARLLFEIGHEGAGVADLRARLGLDSGYFSRLLRGIERKGLARTARMPGHDGRSRFVRLRRSGLSELRRLNVRSDDLARSLLGPLSGEQAQRLISGMAEIEKLLRFSSLEIAIEGASSRDARWCMERYFDELEIRFRGGFDRTAAQDGTPGEFAPPNGCLLVARVLGERAGCAALRTLAPGVGEIKRMWVAPESRGLGVGRALLDELEGIARKRALRLVRLDSNSALKEALRLYQAAGYRRITRYNDNVYAQHWFEKSLR